MIMSCHIIVTRFGWIDWTDRTEWANESMDQIEDALRSINEQLRDAKDGRRMTKHQEKMAECLAVCFQVRLGQASFGLDMKGRHGHNLAVDARAHL